MSKPMDTEFGPVCEIRDGVVKGMSGWEYSRACLRRRFEKMFGRGGFPEGLKEWVRWVTIFILSLAFMMAVVSWVCAYTPLTEWLRDVVFVPVR